MVEGLFTGLRKRFQDSLVQHRQHLEALQRQALKAAHDRLVPPKPPKPDPMVEAYRILGVAPGDPEDLVKAVYRAKAKHLHPDTGRGNTEAFQRLEASYELVMKELRKRGT